MFRNILLAVDLNEESSWAKALPAAVEICRTSGSRLRVLTVVPDFGMSIVGQHFPADFATNAVAANVPADIKASSMVAHGTIYKKILGAAKDLGADLIVVAAHRPSLEDYLLGPNAASVVRHFRGSVLVVRD